MLIIIVYKSMCITSIPYSQALKIKRICSRQADFVKRTDELKKHLMARRYRESMVELQIQQANLVSPAEVLQPHPKRSTLKQIPFVVTHIYLPGRRSLNRLMRKHLPILHISDRLRKTVPEPPLVAYRRPPNLQDLQICAEVKTPAPPTTT